MVEVTRPRRLFGLLCAHDWRETGRFEIRRLIGIDPTKDYSWVGHGHAVELTCRHCGDKKSRRVCRG